MNTKEIIKQLATNRKITIAELERVTNIANGTIGKWDKQNPSIEPLKKIADYFGVTTDYLIGRTEDPTLKFYGDKTFDAISKSFDANNPTYTELFESLPLLSDEELELVNNMVQSLIQLKQKKS